MNEKNNQFSDAERISQEAAEWVVKHDKGFSAREQDGFFQWLADDPRHGDAFADHKQSWVDFNLLAQWRPEHSEEPNPDLLATIKPVRTWRSWTIWGGLAALLTVVSMLWINFGKSRNDAVEAYVLQYSALDYGYHRLEDGSEIDLNEQTELVISYSENQRLIKLNSGEAHFTVTKDPDRPFVVDVGGAKVRAVGTAFNVRLDSDYVEVLVTEGRVRMENADNPYSRDTRKSFNLPSQDLISGQRSVLSFRDRQPQVEVSTVDSGEMARLLDWKPDILDFSSTPLADAIHEFNLRNNTQIVIADPDLSSLPIVASFRSNNINGFVHLLKLTMNIEVDRGNEEEIVLRQSKPEPH